MITVESLEKRLGNTRVLDGISFSAATGEITALLGPNGAGKTTTMRVLATLLRPDSGRAEVAGIDVVAHPDQARRVIGLVTEEPGLFDRLTVREQLGFVGRAYGAAAPDVGRRIDELSEALTLTDQLDLRAGTLSKGNRQKVSLCRALLHDPPVLLLDEPTSGLDVVAAAAVEDLIARTDLLGARTVLLSTHRLDEAERLARRMIGIAAGRVVVDGTPDEVLAQAGSTDLREAFARLLGAASLDAGA